MKKVFRKLLAFLIILFSLNLSVFSQEQYTLENGLSVFLLEDYADALVQIEFVCRAGFSSQTQENAGFFKLYSRLFEAATPQLSFSLVDCGADATRYVIKTPASKLNDVLETLSDSAFSLFYSDDLLEYELEEMKTEVTQNAESLSGFINAAIDSRVFASSPWKHDSGIYPALFRKTTGRRARTLLKDIADKWYTPQNCAVFISGNINSEKVLVQLKNTFGRFYSTYKPEAPESAPAATLTDKKFVLHSPDFSSDLTQIVIQYTSFSGEQADILAAAFNRLLSDDGYIHVGSAHKGNANRLIFQTIIQAPEDVKARTDSPSQAKAFLQLVQNAPLALNSVLLQQANLELIEQEKLRTTNAADKMTYLSEKWVRQPFIQAEDTSLETMQLLFTSEQPFVFVIINSADYKKNKKAYDAAGYQEVTMENASWYTQEMYREIKDQFRPDDKTFYNPVKNSTDNNYYEKNIATISSATLDNGIPVVIRQNDFSPYLTLTLSVRGGKINSMTNNGFEEAMVNLLSMMFQRELNLMQQQGLILGNCSVTNKTELSTSAITIQCENNDFVSVCNGLSKAIIYGDVKPAMADRAVSNRQYKKRLENGTVSNQLQAAAFVTLYGQNQFSSLFETKNEVLSTVSYNQILEQYPTLLDATRYSIILCGNICEDYREILNGTFGQLAAGNLYQMTELPQFQLTKSKAQKVKVVHTFLTDIPAEEAGPMPAVLIPTTEFMDPVLYVVKAPQEGTKEAALFNALVNYTADMLQTELDDNKKLKGAKTMLQLPRYNVPAAFLSIMNVSRTKEADAAFKATVRSIKNRLEAPDANKTIVQSIKDAWIVNQMEKTASNAGTAELIQKGFELFPDSPQPDFYLKEYNFIQTATPEDFRAILDMLPEIPELRIYSEQSK